MVEEPRKIVAVIGAGSSGQAIAAYLGIEGYQVQLWNRDEQSEVEKWLKPIAEAGQLEAAGKIEGTAPIALATTDLGPVVRDADVVIVNTTADAYHDVGLGLAPFINEHQLVLLMSAGTLGAFHLWSGLREGGYTDDLLVGETSTTVFASRNSGPASVHVAGRKAGVEVATLPSGRGEEFAQLLPEFDFVPAGDALSSGFNNMGPSLHAVPLTLTAGWIERHGGEYLHYADGISPSVATVIENFDAERVTVADAYDRRATPVHEYLITTVGAPEGSLYESIHNCAMYATATSVDTLDHRYMWEEILTGVIPVIALADKASVDVPLHRSIATLASALLGRDFWSEGRTAQRVGIDALDVAQLQSLVGSGAELEEWRRAG